MASQDTQSMKVNPQTSDDEEKICHPRAEVLLHSAIKGLEVGSVLGVVVGVPYARFGKGLRSAWDIAASAGSFASRGALAGAVASSALASVRMLRSDDVENYDRAYRLRYNQGQKRADRFSLAGAVVAAGGGLLLPTKIMPQDAAPWGVLVGLVAHAASAKRD